MAKNQIYVVPADEAVYPVTRVDGNGDRLDGRNRYRLVLDSPPPADAFWSLTVYGTPGPLIANPLDRYAIGDRTPGLARGDDGAVTISLQHDEPAEGTSNWLPVPAGPFHLMMRLYWPQPPVLEGRWMPPPVERVHGATVPGWSRHEHHRLAVRVPTEQRSTTTLATNGAPVMNPQGCEWGATYADLSTAAPRNASRRLRTSGLRTYDLLAVDQLRVVDEVDALPNDDDARSCYQRMLATDATIYGLPSVFQYAQLYEQAVDVNSASYTGFNRFLHQRDIATPDFAAFKTPNVDTLYSNAWLDLSGGPAIIEVPPIEDRYYTLQFVDMYGNSTNLSSRTVGPGGGRFFVATTTWDGDAPGRCHPVPRRDAVHVDPDAHPRQGPGARRRARAVAPGSSDDHTADRIGQRRVRGGHLRRGPDTAVPYFRALDWTLRHNGHPLQE